MKNEIIILCLGIIVGIFAGAYAITGYPFNTKSDVELAKVKLEEFNQMEEVCGKGNVRDKCSYGYCDSGYGLILLPLKRLKL